MLRKFFVVADFYLVLLNAASGEWTALKDIGIEFRWTLQAKNSCDISFRQVHAGGKARLTVRSRWYPHKGQKSASVERVGEVELAGKQKVFGIFSDARQLERLRFSGWIGIEGVASHWR